MLKHFVQINKKISGWFDKTFPDFIYEDDYKTILLSRITEYIDKRESVRILEAGGIDRPLLAKKSGITYDGLDIDFKDNCKEIYDDFIVQSLELPIEKVYDLIISITLLEHVPDNRASLKSCFSALSPGGAMMHYTPSKNHPYSLILRLVGPRLQKKIIARLRPEAQDVTGYPAFFDCCSPKEMRTVLLLQGFKNVEIIPIYRAAFYFNFFVPLYLILLLYENLCKKFRFEQLCSGFIVVAEKP